MELYDHIIESTRAALADSRPRRWDFDPAALWPDTGASELVMLRDAAFELGGSGKASANFTCVTGDDALVPRDEVLLYGPDLPQLTGDVSFARLVFLLVDDIGTEEEAFSAIRDMEFVKYHVFPKGYMVRTSAESNREQVRVSRAALREGIDFRCLGNAYLARYKQNAHIRRAQVVFLTDQAVIAELAKTAKQVDAITKTLTHILEGIPTDCGNCSLKPVCDEVEGMRELHFGMKNMK